MVSLVAATLESGDDATLKDSFEDMVKAAVKKAVDGGDASLQAAGAGTPADPAKTADDIIKDAQDAAIRIVACSTSLTNELNDSKLPDRSKDRIRKLYAGMNFEVADLQASIKDETVSTLCNF